MSLADLPPTVMRMRSGGLLDLAAPSERDFTLADVVLGLSRLPRWLGQTARMISVLEHSLVVARLARPRDRLPALLHDAPEAFIGDLTRPLRRTMGISLLGFAGRLAPLEHRLMRAVCRLTLEPYRDGLNLLEAESALASLAVAMGGGPADNQALDLEFRFDSDDPDVRALYPLDEPEAADLRALWLSEVDAAAAVWAG